MTGDISRGIKVIHSGVRRAKRIWSGAPLVRSSQAFPTVTWWKNKGWEGKKTKRRTCESCLFFLQTELWSNMYALMSGSHAALNCPILACGLMWHSLSSEKEEEQWGSVGESVWCTNQEPFPTGATHAKNVWFFFFFIVCRIQPASREVKTVCLAIKRSAHNDIKSAWSAFWRLYAWQLWWRRKSKR